MSIGIAAIVKNELPYLMEWIAFHRAANVDRFFIADNNSTDGTKELLIALDAAGIVNFVDFPGQPDQAPQLPAYSKLLQDFGSEVDWLAFIDADEFMMPQGDCVSISDLVKSLEVDQTIGSIALNWAIYGSSGYTDPSPGFVIERFHKRAEHRFGGNFHYKSIVRLSAVVSVGNNPHHFKLKDGFRVVHTNGIDLRDNLVGKGLSEQIIWDHCRLNHYVVKSLREFIENKQPRGRADVPSLKRTSSFFEDHDRDDVVEMMNEELVRKTWQEARIIEKLLGMQLTLSAFDYWSNLPKAAVISS